MATYGYCRVSTAAQASEGESLDVQRRVLEGWAHMQGQRLDAVFVERGVSGSMPLPTAVACFTSVVRPQCSLSSKPRRQNSSSSPWRRVWREC